MPLIYAAGWRYRLQLDADLLRMVLELAEDVSEVYRTADEATKRRYNQAFFKRIYVTPEWDDDDGTTVRVTTTELTEPYAVLLEEGSLKASKQSCCG